MISIWIALAFAAFAHAQLTPELEGTNGVANGLCQLNYILQSDVFVSTANSSGSQHVQGLDCTSGLLHWHMTFDWANGGVVLAYPNAQISPVGAKLSDLKSVPGIYQYATDATDMVASYVISMWLNTNMNGQTADATSKAELIIILGADGNAAPGGDKVGSFSALSDQWTLYKANGSSYDTITAVSRSVHKNFTGDLLDVLASTVQTLSISDDLYVVSYSAGVSLIGGKGSFDAHFGGDLVTSNSCDYVDASLKTASKLCSTSGNNNGAEVSSAHRPALATTVMLLAFLAVFRQQSNGVTRQLTGSDDIATGLCANHYILASNVIATPTSRDTVQTTQGTGCHDGLLSWQTSFSWVGSALDLKSSPTSSVSAAPARLSSITSIPTVYAFQAPLAVQSVYMLDAWLSSSASSKPGDSSSRIEIVAVLSTGGLGFDFGEQKSTINAYGLSWAVYQYDHPNYTTYNLMSQSTLINVSIDAITLIHGLAGVASFASDLYLSSYGAGAQITWGDDSTLTVQSFGAQVYLGQDCAGISSELRSASLLCEGQSGNITNVSSSDKLAGIGFAAPLDTRTAKRVALIVSGLTVAMLSFFHARKAVVLSIATRALAQGGTTADLTGIAGIANNLCALNYVLSSNTFQNGTATTHGLGCTNGLLSWKTDFDFDTDAVAAYPNSAISDPGAKIADLKSVPVIFKFQPASAAQANYMVTIWLGTNTNGQAGDSSSKYEVAFVFSNSGTTTPAGSKTGTITAMDTNWSVYKSAAKGYDLVTVVSRSRQSSVSGDLLDVIQATVKSLSIDQNLYVVSLGAGAQILTGKGTFQCDAFGADLITGGACSTVDATLKSAAGICGSSGSSNSTASASGKSTSSANVLKAPKTSSLAGAATALALGFVVAYLA
ncbi:glycoside hydrolase family 12 protein [Mixia osmundae IAM 14324]|uniref:Uncharacterized protein n=1 Tax=Mixia osmundae (strain CBS 9802 / IAM 14324 / JCM 22182 / KY 12970) TaxID=764103 RepID=G7E802_MIXOS|nr:glycoside hydrolase family 12 protein [Mixia osmundae IAM 14324]KEI38561.1 glycoside hydrolase family 12 protein [Mixia osmundae IAM 14324]GAA98962.1 hypothetical protein E5Q_05650 [Mixia osmundae IAM 14324]